jgi:hypothetical protein
MAPFLGPVHIRVETREKKLEFLFESQSFFNIILQFEVRTTTIHIQITGKINKQ